MFETSYGNFVHGSQPVRTSFRFGTLSVSSVSSRFVPSSSPPVETYSSVGTRRRSARSTAAAAAVSVREDGRSR